MPEYRRVFIPGGTYFLTVVTYKRKPIFNHTSACDLLKKVWVTESRRHPFTTNAFCLLPDHFHCVITLPESDINYPMRIREIKRLFSIKYPVTEQNDLIDSRTKRSERYIWQRRFWEHTIRNENDLDKHIQYIHFNPVKHGYVDQVKDWRFSSFHRFVESGLIDMNWGTRYQD